MTLRAPAIAKHRRLDFASALSPALRGMLWMVLASQVFTVLSTIMRVIAQHIAPFEMQFLRYFCGMLVMLPFIMRVGFASYAPSGLTGHLWRGVVHT